MDLQDVDLGHPIDVCSCGSKIGSKVIESRKALKGQATRRRRECLSCGERFTTYELRIEAIQTLIIGSPFAESIMGFCNRMRAIADGVERIATKEMKKQ